MLLHSSKRLLSKIRYYTYQHIQAKNLRMYLNTGLSSSEPNTVNYSISRKNKVVTEEENMISSITKINNKNRMLVINNIQQS